MHTSYLSHYPNRIPVHKSQNIPAVQNTKVDQLHERMRQGDWKPAQIADISTEYLQHLRDEGMSYDKIADAVGMSKSGVAARLKGYIPKNTNK